MRKLNNKIKFKIAADGSSASGKTTGGKLIAKKFKMKFLSSGALYRFCAYKILNNKNKYDIKFVNKIAKTIKLNKLNDKRLYSPEVNQIVVNYSKKTFCKKSSNKFSKKLYKKLQSINN